MTADGAAGLTWTIDIDGARAIIAVKGDLDMARFSLVEDAVLGVIDELREIELDLSEIGFMDSSGVRFLLNVRAAAEARGAVLSLRRASPGVYRVLDLTGTLALFPVTDQTTETDVERSPDEN